MKQPEFFSVAQLKRERLYTDSIINLLGEPDKYARNPYYRSAPDMKQYKIERVLEFEKTPEFKAAFVICRKLSERATKGAKKGVITKIEKTCDVALSTLCIDLPDLSREELTLIACEHYNQLKQLTVEYDYFKEATPASDEGFLKRITGNYLRHMCSEYDDSLDGIRGQVGKDIAYSEVREKIEEAIREKYPYLIKEQAE